MTNEKALLKLTISVLEEFVGDIDKSGGILEDPEGLEVPAADVDWFDLVVTYRHAQAALKRCYAAGYAKSKS